MIDDIFELKYDELAVRGSDGPDHFEYIVMEGTTARDIVNYSSENLEPLLENLDYSDGEIYAFRNVLDELVSNARIHGNRSGWKKEYECRELDYPDDRYIGRNVGVAVEIGMDYWLMAVTDEGKGHNGDSGSLLASGLKQVDAKCDFVRPEVSVYEKTLNGVEEVPKQCYTVICGKRLEK